MKKKKNPHLSIFGQSMGSIFAALAAGKIGAFDNLILVSPAHVPLLHPEQSGARISHVQGTGHDALLCLRSGVSGEQEGFP